MNMTIKYIIHVTAKQPKYTVSFPPISSSVFARTLHMIQHPIIHPPQQKNDETNKCNIPVNTYPKYILPVPAIPKNPKPASYPIAFLLSNPRYDKIYEISLFDNKKSSDPDYYSYDIVAIKLEYYKKYVMVNLNVHRGTDIEK